MVDELLISFLRPSIEKENILQKLGISYFVKEKVMQNHQCIP